MGSAATEAEVSEALATKAEVAAHKVTGAGVAIHKEIIVAEVFVAITVAVGKPDIFSSALDITARLVTIAITGVTHMNQGMGYHL
jgi:hypothetical protein